MNNRFMETKFHKRCIRAAEGHCVEASFVRGIKSVPKSIGNLENILSAATPYANFTELSPPLMNQDSITDLAPPPTSMNQDSSWNPNPNITNLSPPLSSYSSSSGVIPWSEVLSYTELQFVLIVLFYCFFLCFIRFLFLFAFIDINDFQMTINLNLLFQFLFTAVSKKTLRNICITRVVIRDIEGTL